MRHLVYRLGDIVEVGWVIGWGLHLIEGVRCIEADWVTAKLLSESLRITNTRQSGLGTGHAHHYLGVSVPVAAYVELRLERSMRNLHGELLLLETARVAEAFPSLHHASVQRTGLNRSPN